MIEERARELTSALRSGEYEQGTKALCKLREDGTKEWCCLGVACDLAVKAGVTLAVTTDETEYIDDKGNYRRVAYDTHDGILPQAVMDHFGFKTETGHTGSDEPHIPRVIPSMGETTFSSLAQANDYGTTFTQIADFIDENWAAL